MDEGDLVGRARRGDAAAYEGLVHMHQELAFRAAYLVTGDADEAADAAQEGFIKAYYALNRFHEGSPFRPWLLRIVSNEARNRRKASARRTNLGVRYALHEGEPVGESPEAAAVVAEERLALRDAIARLREDDRLVIAYRYLLELGEAETADALDIPRGTVKSRLSRALVRLRDVMTAHQGGVT